MIPLLLRPLTRYRIHRIRMNQNTQRPAINDQPRNESPKLRWREEVHFKHGYRVRPNWSFPELVDAELGDYAVVRSISV
jgi:hypothetical protein